MKKLLKLISIVLFVLLAVSSYSRGFAFYGVNNCIEFNAGEISDLKGCSYQLYFFPLTLSDAGNFTSAIIESSETDSTFSLALFSVGNPDGITYLDCPYEAYGCQSTLFVGHQPLNLDGAGFTITGITMGNQCLIGIFQFRLVTLQPVEYSYLFWGRKISGE